MQSPRLLFHTMEALRWFSFPLLLSSREYSSTAVGLKLPRNHIHIKKKNKTYMNQEFGKNSLIPGPTRKEIWEMFKPTHSKGDMKTIVSADRGLFYVCSNKKGLREYVKSNVK